MNTDELFSLQINKPDDNVRMIARDKWDSVAKPVDSLGDFEDLICRVAAIQKSADPDLSKKALVIMCADNGVVSEGVSPVNQKVTYDMAVLMGRRKSSVGVMTSNYLLDIFTYDVGINSEDTPEGVIDRKICAGTADFVKEPAMSREQCLAAIEVGMDAVRECRDHGYRMIATGEMGIGNTTTSTALLCAVLGIAPEECAGKGCGLTDEGLSGKIRVIKEGLSLHVREDAVSADMDVFEAQNGKRDSAHGPGRGLSKDVPEARNGKRDTEHGPGRESSKEDTFEALRHLGGLDIAALAGVFIGGALYEIPIVIDGLISAAAALAAEKLVPGCRDYMIASHLGREKGMDLILKELSLRPVIHADMALGEGTGAVMLLPLLDMAVLLYTEGTAFAKTPIEQCQRNNA